MKVVMLVKARRMLCAVLMIALLCTPFGTAFAMSEVKPKEMQPLLLDKAQRLTLNEKKKTLNLGDTLQLTAIDSSGTPVEVRWFAKSSVVRVDTNGLVTAVRKGTTTVTARTLDNKRMASCKILVNVPVTGFALKQQALVMTKGKTKKLGWAFEPNYASNKKLTFKSSNTKVATVSKSGVIRAKRRGSSTITATTKDGSFQSTCLVTVTKNPRKVKELLPRAPVGALKPEDLYLSIDGIKVPFPLNVEAAYALLPNWSLYNNGNKQQQLCYNFNRIEFIKGRIDYASFGGINEGNWLNPFKTHRTSCTITTPRGITLGDTLDDVIQAYGTPVLYGREPGMGDMLWYYIDVKNKTHCLGFDIDTSTERIYQIYISFNTNPNDDWSSLAI